MLWFVVSILSLAITLASGPVAAMSQYQWKHRPLLVFATSADNAMLALQRQIVAGSRAGFIERDMLIIWVVGSSVSAEFGPAPVQSAAALRSRYGVSRGDFRVILIGKDGGIKITTAIPLSAAALFRTIDAMPMRRDEMQKR